MSSGKEHPEFDPFNPELGGVYGKMNRAVDHVKELDRWFKDWRGSETWRAVAEKDNEGLVTRLRFEITEPIPTWVGLVAGDAIHNLRCALDHLAAAVAIRNGRSVNSVSFPIASDPKVYAQLRNTRLAKCPEAFRRFVDDLEPYKGGNEVLYALHQLDIIDKHRVLVPIGAGSEVNIDADAGLYGAIDFAKTTEPVKIKSIGTGGLVKDGDTIIEFGPNFWMPKDTEFRTETTVLVVFGDDTPVKRREINSTLRTMVEAVESVIVDAEPQFFR